MTRSVVFLRSAEDDLKELRRYIVVNFGHATWRTTFSKIKESVELIRPYPDSGSIPAELIKLQLTQYRQINCGMNRIVYEVRGDIAYIHLICDVRRDLKTMLMRRLLGGR